MPSVPCLGILLLDTSFPRIPGDVGHPDSYSFPTLMKTVPGATVQRAVFEADPSLIKSFMDAALQMEAEGVCAITSSCGFLSPLQKKLAEVLRVPLFLSSLLQVPLVHTITGGRIGILTASAPSLSEYILNQAGITDSIPLAIAGMQDSPAFSEPILKDGAELQRDKVEEEVLEQAQKLLFDHPDISAFVFECHNLAPYGKRVQNETGKPVFDIISFAEWVYHSIVKTGFPNPYPSPGE